MILLMEIVSLTFCQKNNKKFLYAKANAFESNLRAELKVYKKNIYIKKKYPHLWRMPWHSK